MRCKDCQTIIPRTVMFCAYCGIATGYWAPGSPQPSPAPKWLPQSRKARFARWVTGGIDESERFMPWPSLAWQRGLLFAGLPAIGVNALGRLLWMSDGNQLIASIREIITAFIAIDEQDADWGNSLARVLETPALFVTDVLDELGTAVLYEAIPDEIFIGMAAVLIFAMVVVGVRTKWMAITRSRGLTIRMAGGAVVVGNGLIVGGAVFPLITAGTAVLLAVIGAVLTIVVIIVFFVLVVTAIVAIIGIILWAVLQK